MMWANSSQSDCLASLNAYKVCLMYLWLVLFMVRGYAFFTVSFYAFDFILSLKEWQRLKATRGFGRKVSLDVV